MAKPFVARISQRDFWKRLRARPTEHVDVINMIEAHLRKKRGFVFRLPKPGTPVILLVSGGIDSITTWALLMQQYHLRVYPVFLRRGIERKKREYQSMQLFCKLFKKRYASLYVAPIELSAHVPPPEIEKEASNLLAYFHPTRMLSLIGVSKITAENFSQNGLPFILPFYALAYARLLYDRDNLSVKTIFNAVVAGDGEVIYSQTFTSLRTTQLALCMAINDYTMQFTSFAFEKELGHWLTKSDLIQIGTRMHLPLEYTWTCSRANQYHCGDCIGCWYRREEFNRAHIPDHTIYLSQMKLKQILHQHIQRLLQKIF